MFVSLFTGSVRAARWQANDPKPMKQFGGPIQQDDIMGDAEQGSADAMGGGVTGRTPAERISK